MQIYVHKVTRHRSKFKSVRIEEYIPVKLNQLKFYFCTLVNGDMAVEQGYVAHYNNKQVRLYRCIRKNKALEMSPIYTDWSAPCIPNNYLKVFKLEPYL